MDDLSKDLMPEQQQRCTRRKVKPCKGLCKVVMVVVVVV